MSNARHLTSLAALALAGVGAILSPALAQDATPPAETPAAMDVIRASAADLRKIIRDGSAAAERQAALDDLAALAQQGDATAALYLGDVYRTGTFVPEDPARAVAAYRLAVAKSNPTAARRLADLHLGGDAPDVTAAEALEFYEMAAEAGDEWALQKLGDLYRDGTLVTADATRAADYYRAALEAGRPTAAIRLGDLYRDGLDPAASLDIYRTAAEAGDTTAMLRLGDAYRDGIGGQPDLVRAAEQYQAAYDAGADSAFFRLARAKLAVPGQAEEAVALLEAAIAEGRPNAALVLGTAYLDGEGVPVDVERAVTVLRSGAENGDVNAARRLVRLYVDGKGPALASNPLAARAILASVRDQLDAEPLLRDTVSVDGAVARDPAAFADLVDRFSQLDGTAQSSVAGQLHRANPNAYVALLQAHLLENGLYSGELSGLLTQSTITAFNRLCAEQDASDDCTGGPLSTPARNVFRAVLEQKG